MKDWRKNGLIAVIIIIILIPIAGLKFKKGKLQRLDSVTPEFVGGQQCLSCHPQEHALWEKSHHAHAMDHANDSSVLGNFDNAEYTANGTTHKFYKSKGKYYTYTRGVGGKMAEYEITYTFGYTPLQQYLVPFENGKFQCLPIAWDTEKEEWFDMGALVYGNQEILPDNWLYWTNQAQNWNGMCAECHSTNVKKNYFAELDSFNTTWSEINVSCEACHGPGSKHIAWTEWSETKQKTTENFGLVAKTSGINNEEYVNLCARCHSRRSQLGNFQHENKDLLDFMIPSLLHDEYFPDGQILDEDYVFGSFIQSKMYHTDIKCNDCHNVHSGERHFDGNALCLQCHKADYYGTSKHHFHKNIGEPAKPYFVNSKEVATGEGANCVNCHMPGRYYMGNDFRNDHSIRIPRPDLSKEIGVPNACNQCHTDKSIDWSIRNVQEWYGKKDRPHYGSAIALGREQKPEALPKLNALVRDDLTPLIVRATSLELLANYTDTSATSTILRALDAPESLLRLSAVRIYNNPNPNEFIKDLTPLLDDPVKAVRIEAGLKFSYLPNNLIPEVIKVKLENAISEYKEQNEYMADFPGGSGNLGLIHSNMGNYTEAIKHYERAVKTDKQFYPALINLALAYNQTGRNNDAEEIYKDLIDNNADLPGVYYSLGLLLVEEKKYEEGIKYLELATQKSPENSRINYNLGLLYAQLGRENQAEKQLRNALNKESENYDYGYALAHFFATTNQFNKAEAQIEKMQIKFPGNDNLLQLINYLEQIKNTK